MRSRWGFAVSALASAVIVLGACDGGGDERESAGPTEGVPTTVPGPAGHARGRSVFAGSGCLACHRLGDGGNPGPGPDLSHVGARMTRDELVRELVSPTPPMPSYALLREKRPGEFRALVRYLESLE